MSGFERPRPGDDAAPGPPPQRQARPESAAAGGGEGAIAALLGLATLAALGLAGVYVAGGQPQAEGALLAVSLGALGAALVLWARRLLPEGEVTGERGELPSPPGELAAAEASLGAGGEELGGRGPTRRRFLLRMLGGAAGALGLAALFPIRSLGPEPGRSLFRTAWSAGVRLVDPDGRPVPVDRLEVNGLLTVFPEGRLQAGDSQAVLIRLPPGLARPREGRESWSPEGYVCYSKICTHVGCPVGLYQTSTHELLCPCHQSTFDVLDGARPVFGPATRSLPQLPLAVRNGFLVAAGDFPEPVGPAFWDRG